MRLSFMPREQFWLVMKESDWKAMHQHLLQADGQERAALGLLGTARRGRVRELYVHRLELPSDQDYTTQNGVFVELAPQYTVDSLGDFAKSDATGYLYAHSHPFSTHARFSGFDNAHHPRLAKGLGQFLTFQEQAEDAENALFVRLVCGQAPEGFSADVFDAQGNLLGPIRAIRRIGPDRLSTLYPGRRMRPRFPFPPRVPFIQAAVNERWTRNVAWMGPEGQRTLSETSLAIAGAGGAGCLALQIALGLGFRTISLIDFDRVELSNLNRLPGLTTADVGRFKVEALADVARREYPDVRIGVVAHPIEHTTAQQAILEHDVLFTGMDDDEARLTAQTLAARHLKPLLDVGTGFQLDDEGEVAQMGGQLSFYVPGGPCLLCQELDPSRIVPRASRIAQVATGYVAGTDLNPAAALTVNAAVVSIAMDVLVRYLTGFAPFSTFVQVDLLHHEIQPLAFSRKADCPVCGDDGAEGLGAGRAKVRPCRAHRRTNMPAAIRA